MRFRNLRSQALKKWSSGSISNLNEDPIPKGPRTQIINRVLGPKYNNRNGIWALISDYLGPWTLREWLSSNPYRARIIVVGFSNATSLLNPNSL